MLIDTKSLILLVIDFLMKLFGVKIHFRKVKRKVYYFFSNMPFVVKCKIHHVRCVIGNNSLLTGCAVKTKRKNGELFIGNDCIIKNTVFNYYGVGGKIVINNHVKINARSEAKTRLYVKNQSSITIDDDCLLSNDIDISTTDWHSVIDKDGFKVNNEKDVYVGRHVWIGRKVIIGKGVSINENSVIGAGSIVTKPFAEHNVIIAGNPASVRKSNVNWK